MDLFELPHAVARRRLAAGETVYLTVNPVEYHGPHLSLHNDRLVSRGLVRDLHARFTQVTPANAEPLFAADLEVGVDPTAGLGTRRISFETTRAVVLEAARALADLGARRVVLMTFHGAPLHAWAIEAGVSLLRQRGVRAVAPFNLVMRELMTLDDPDRYADAYEGIADARERSQMLRDIGSDFHAGYFETSLALHYAPHSVDPGYTALPPCETPPPQPGPALAARVARAAGASATARELDLVARGLAFGAQRPFYGYTGRPHRASPAAGRAFARHLVARMAPAVERALEGRGESPAPILPWLPVLARLGLVRDLSVPLADVVDFESPGALRVAHREAYPAG